MNHEKFRVWNREYQKARKLTLERDKHSCQICKGKSEKLFGKKFRIVVHHIKKVKNLDIEMLRQQ